jgi:hypothetical protein
MGNRATNEVTTYLSGIELRETQLFCELLEFALLSTVL